MDTWRGEDYVKRIIMDMEVLGRRYERMGRRKLYGYVMGRRIMDMKYWEEGIKTQVEVVERMDLWEMKFKTGTDGEPLLDAMTP